MRKVSNIPDVQQALNELFAFKDSFKSKDLSLGGRRVTGAAPARRRGEYATLEQIPVITDPVIKHKEQFYTVVFTFDGIVTDGQVMAPFVVGYGREGIPHQVWLQALTHPSGGPLAINVQVTTIDTQTDLDVDTVILDDNLSLADGQTRRVFSSTFITSVPKLQRLSWFRPLIISANAAALVSIGVVVKRF